MRSSPSPRPTVVSKARKASTQGVPARSTTRGGQRRGSIANSRAPRSASACASAGASASRPLSVPKRQVSPSRSRQWPSDSNSAPMLRASGASRTGSAALNFSSQASIA